MKKLSLIILGMCMLGIQSYAQNVDFENDKSTWIHLSILIPDQEGEAITTGAKSYLTNKLKQIAVKNGVAANEDFSRFFITTVITPLTKDVLPGPPAQVAENLEMTFYIADYYDQKVYSSTSMEIKAIGTNDTKAYINGIKNINVNNKELASFMDEGKKKIIAYYNARCAQIMKIAQTKADQKQYEAALYDLVSVPEVCDCYDEVLALSQKIYQQYIDNLCQINLAKARAAWAAHQNSSGAEDAGQYLSQILPDASCYGDAMALYTEIKAKVLDDWKFEMKIYQDQVDLEKQRIEAMRQVGIAYGNHQQPTTTVFPWLR